MDQGPVRMKAAPMRRGKRRVDPTGLLEKRIAALSYFARALSPDGLFLWNAVHVDPPLIVKYCKPETLAVTSHRLLVLGLGLSRLLGLGGGEPTLRGLTQLMGEFEEWLEGAGQQVIVAPRTPEPVKTEDPPKLEKEEKRGPRTVNRTKSGPAARKAAAVTPATGDGKSSAAISGGGGGGIGGLSALFSRARESGPFPDSVTNIVPGSDVRAIPHRHRGRVVFEFLPGVPPVPFSAKEGDASFTLVASAFCEAAGQVYRKLADGTVAWSGPEADAPMQLVQALRRADRALKHHGIKPLALLLTAVARKAAAQHLNLLSEPLFSKTTASVPQTTPPSALEQHAVSSSESEDEEADE